MDSKIAKLFPRKLPDCISGQRIFRELGRGGAGRSVIYQIEHQTINSYLRPFLKGNFSMLCEERCWNDIRADFK